MAIGNITAYNAEYTPDSVRAVGQAVVDHFPELTWDHIGFKGDDAHYGGYHRSLRWNTSTLGAGGDYSDQIGRDTSQRNHLTRRNAIRGIDVSAPDHILIPMCQRLDQAVRAGLLEDVREWYGNRDGDSRVDGYDNFRDIVVSSDASHLWHAHISLYTDTVDGPHDRLTAVLLGTPGWNQEDDMPTVEEFWGAKALEYTDENGNKKRDNRTPKDILFAAHAAAVEARNEARTSAAQQKLRDEAILAAVVDNADRDAILARVDAKAAELAQVADVDEAALADRLGPMLLEAMTPDQVADALAADPNFAGLVVAAIGVKLSGQSGTDGT